MENSNIPTVPQICPAKSQLQNQAHWPPCRSMTLNRFQCALKRNILTGDIAQTSFSNQRNFILSSRNLLRPLASGLTSHMAPPASRNRYMSSGDKPKKLVSEPRPSARQVPLLSHSANPLTRQHPAHLTNQPDPPPPPRPNLVFLPFCTRFPRRKPVTLTRWPNSLSYRSQKACRWPGI